MNIGAGFSKPSIRGMAFNRIAVVENGVKQEGQQWGADHGLEIDAFNVEQVEVRKGPASLQYGSDAMGGVVEIKQLPPLHKNGCWGEVTALAQSNNNLLGASAMLGFKKDAWHGKLRFTEQHFGDYGIPADTIVYLTYKIPVYDRKLKNTAGYERNIHSQLSFRSPVYEADLFVSNTFQKAGFFPGAHGTPDVERVKPDASTRNIELPYSNVNHLKMQFRQLLRLSASHLEWNMAYQNNHRQEWSLFHTHYSSQTPPAVNPDLELDFRIETFSSSLKWLWNSSEHWESAAGLDLQYQRNAIDGYGFLLPDFRRFTSGGYVLAVYKLNERLRMEGGVRYDWGAVHTESFTDLYLERYLIGKKHPQNVVDAYKQRSAEVNRRFNDVSGAAGMVYNPSAKHWWKWNIGRSFRLPGANELAANGLHHGAFRHEQGDSKLPAEKAWQLDAAYNYAGSKLSLSVSPFVSWFDNYIYLKPTGEWSLLPHAGQIYRYTVQEALFAGGEISLDLNFAKRFRYSLAGEYVFTYNIDENTALPFSPPATLRNTLAYERKKWTAYVENQLLAAQNRIARNEERTAGACLFHAGIHVELPLGNETWKAGLSVQNIFNTMYYNHLSFYRKVEIPEPGRNIQIIINIPFKTN
jgi:iron complex outermembrane receptor protein